MTRETVSHRYHQSPKLPITFTPSWWVGNLWLKIGKSRKKIPKDKHGKCSVLINIKRRKKISTKLEHDDSVGIKMSSLIRLDNYHDNNYEDSCITRRAELLSLSSELFSPFSWEWWKPQHQLMSFIVSSSSFNWWAVNYHSYWLSDNLLSWLLFIENLVQDFWPSTILFDKLTIFLNFSCEFPKNLAYISRLIVNFNWIILLIISILIWWMITIIAYSNSPEAIYSIIYIGCL